MGLFSSLFGSVSGLLGGGGGGGSGLSTSPIPEDPDQPFMSGMSMNQLREFGFSAEMLL